MRRERRDLPLEGHCGVAVGHLVEDEGVEQARQLLGAAVQARDDMGGVAQAAPHIGVVHRGEQPVLGPVVVDDRALGDAEFPGDVAEVGLAVPALGDEAREGGQDVLRPASGPRTALARPVTVNVR